MTLTISLRLCADPQYVDILRRKAARVLQLAVGEPCLREPRLSRRVIQYRVIIREETRTGVDPQPPFVVLNSGHWAQTKLGRMDNVGATCGCRLWISWHRMVSALQASTSYYGASG